VWGERWRQCAARQPCRAHRPWTAGCVAPLQPHQRRPPRPMNLTRIAPPRLDHLFLTPRRWTPSLSSLREILDFRLTEQVMGMTASRSPPGWRCRHLHDIAVITGSNQGLHHFAFWWTTGTNLRQAPPMPARTTGVHIETNPTRHGCPAASACISSTPCGNRNEMFTGGYWVDPDAEPITWTRRRWAGPCSTTTESATRSSSRCTHDRHRRRPPSGRVMARQAGQPAG